MLFRSQVNLLDIELLTIKLRLVIASVDRAKEMGIDWWEHDPTLSSGSLGRDDMVEENRRLRERLAAIEAGESDDHDADDYDADDDYDRDDEPYDEPYDKPYERADDEPRRVERRERRRRRPPEGDGRG